VTVDLPGPRRCIIEGTHSLVLVPRSDAEDNRPVGILGIKTRGNAVDNPDLWLAGTIQSLAEMRRKTGRPIKLVQLNRGKGIDDTPKTDTALFSAPADAIEKWVCNRLDEMLNARSCDHLPFSVVQALVKQPARKDSRIPWEKLWEKITPENIEEKLEAEVYHCYLPAFALTDARIPSLTNSKLQDLARRRFAPMLEGRFYE